MKAISSSRRPVQAGRFYPADPDELREVVEQFISAAPPHVASAPGVGFVTPHAGYSFSGGTAGHTYRQLREIAPDLVFIFAPSHHAAFPLASVWDGAAYTTPLGEYPIDQSFVSALRKRLPGVGHKKWAEEIEHSLEVQIPFLQIACPNAKMVPVLLGGQDQRNVETMADAIATICEGMAPGQVTFLASSDAYHGHSLERCQISDEVLSNILVNMDVDALYHDVDSGKTMACGYGAIALVMQVSRYMGARKGTVLNQTSSAEIMPYRKADYVVGYLSAMFD